MQLLIVSSVVLFNFIWEHVRKYVRSKPCYSQVDCLTVFILLRQTPYPKLFFALPPPYVNR